VKNPAAKVIWTGRVPRAELAVPCHTCNVGIGVECDTMVFGVLPHYARRDFAEVLGFKDVVELGGLFAVAA
jgi:hypothetical protein